MKVQDTSVRALDKVETETSSSWHKIRDYLDLGGKPPAKEKSRVQPRYCYGAYHDVICYPSPIPGQEERLVAYQNSAGTGYTLAPQKEHTSAPQKKAPKPAKTEEKSPEATAAPTPAAHGAVSSTPAPTPAPTATTTTTASPAAAAGPAPLATMPEIKPEPTPAPAPAATPAPTPAPAPAPQAGVQAPGKPEESKKLKEITFDPSELEPKKLVPDRLQ